MQPLSQYTSGTQRTRHSRLQCCSAVPCSDSAILRQQLLKLTVNSITVMTVTSQYVCVLDILAAITWMNIKQENCKTNCKQMMARLFLSLLCFVRPNTVSLLAISSNIELTHTVKALITDDIIEPMASKIVTNDT